MILAAALLIAAIAAAAYGIWFLAIPLLAMGLACSYDRVRRG